MRGKHGSAAAVRHVREELASSVDTYQRAVVRLTKERDEARAERDEAQATMRASIRRLSAERDAGTGPRVEALERTVTQLREEKQRIRADLAEQITKVIWRYGLQWPADKAGAASDAMTRVLGRSCVPPQYTTGGRAERRSDDRGKNGAAMDDMNRSKRPVVVKR